MTTRGHEERLAGRALVVLGGKVAGIALSLGAAFVLPRQLGPRGMGFYGYFSSWVFAMVCLMDAGGGMVIRRYLPDLLGHSPGMVRSLLLKTLGSKALVWAVLALALPWVSDKTAFLLALAAAMGASLVDTFQAMFYGAGRLGWYAATGGVVLGLRLLAVVLMAPWQRVGIALALVVSSWVVVGLLLPPTLRLLPRHRVPLDRPYRWYLRFGLTSYLADLAFVLSNRVVLVVTRHAVGDMAEVGYLGFALMVSLVGRQLAFFIGESSLPRMVQLYSSGDRAGYEALVSRVWRGTNALAWGIAFLLFSFARPWVRLAAGDAFAPAAPLVRVLSLAMVASTLTLCIRMVHFAQENPRRLVLAHGTSLLLLVAVGMVAVAGRIPTGTVGMAWVFTGACVVGLVLMGWGEGASWLAVPARAAGAALVCAVGVGLVRGLPMGVAMGVGGSAYVLLLLLLRALLPEDVATLTSLISRGRARA